MKKTLITIAVAGTLLVGGTMVKGQTSTEFASLSEIKTAQEQYKNSHGKYLQVTGNKLSKEQTGTVKQKLGKDMPVGYTIDEYVSPLGAGFSIFWTDSEGEHRQGFGPEATERTKFIPTKKATST